MEEIAEGDHNDGALAKKPKLSQKIKLEEMPIEILEHILVHLDDKSLLRASHVCTLFASVAETAFALKYSNASYMILGRSWDNMSFHEVMLSKYGDKIRKLEIQIDEKDERLLDLAERTCCNLNSLALYNPPKIILITGLREARLVWVRNLNRASFVEFIHKNRQLEILQLGDNNVDLLTVLDRLNDLKTLEYACNYRSANDLPTIRLNALETLKLGILNTENCARVLRAITCNDLKSLYLTGNHIDLPGSVIDQIYSFGTLATLQLGMYKITECQLKALARRLPHITEFGMGIMKNVEHTIRLSMQFFSKLAKLSIGMKADDYCKLSDDLKRSMHEFYIRFVVTNTEIELVNGHGIISISKDRLFAVDSNTYSFELLWLENLNEKNVRKVLAQAAENCPLFGYLNIINECADSTLDISNFMHKCFKSTGTVDIESKGPITVNANATRFPSFFPRLKKFKIQLGNHSVVGLLEKLDRKFCKRIEELSIDTKNVQNDNDQELEHGNDITHILAKFKNLRSLHVSIPATNFDANHLMSVCPKIKDLRV